MCTVLGNKNHLPQGYMLQGSFLLKIEAAASETPCKNLAKPDMELMEPESKQTSADSSFRRPASKWWKLLVEALGVKLQDMVILEA